MKKKTEVKITKNRFLKILQDPSRFKKLDDGWVRDTLVGVEWGPSSAETMNFKEAQDYCAKLGGRLPEINELQSLVDYSRRGPAINDAVFPDTKTDDWYWTGTEVADSSDRAWCVGFDRGYVGYCEDYDGYVRPVRAFIYKIRFIHR